MTREEYEKAVKEGAWLVYVSDYVSDIGGYKLVRSSGGANDAYLERCLRIATPNDMLKYDVLRTYELVFPPHPYPNPNPDRVIGAFYDAVERSVKKRDRNK